MQVLKVDESYVMIADQDEFDALKLSVRDALIEHQKEDLYGPHTVRELENLDQYFNRM